MSTANNPNQNTKKDFPGKWLFNHVVMAAILVVALIVGAYVFLNVVTKHGQELVVPDLSNMTVEEAASAAESHKMVLEVKDSVYVKRMKKGAVYRQNPAPGSHVKSGRRISVTINAQNSKQITMPNLFGISLRQAKAEILSRGLLLGKLIYKKDIATNNVLMQLYRNEEIAPGTLIDSESVIDLVLGLNDIDTETYVPDVIGLKRMSAVDAVLDHSLNVKGLKYDKSVKDFDDSLNAMVYRQVPEPSDSIAVGIGSEVTLYLTLDEHKIPIRQTEE